MVLEVKQSQLHIIVNMKSGEGEELAAQHKAMGHIWIGARETDSLGRGVEHI